METLLCLSHRNQKILGVCVYDSCLLERPYCHDCIKNHIEHLNELQQFKEFKDTLIIEKKKFQAIKLEILLLFKSLEKSLSHLSLNICEDFKNANMLNLTIKQVIKLKTFSLGLEQYKHQLKKQIDSFAQYIFCDGQPFLIQEVQQITPKVKIVISEPNIFKTEQIEKIEQQEEIQRLFIQNENTEPQFKEGEISCFYDHAKNKSLIDLNLEDSSNSSEYFRKIGYKPIKLEFADNLKGENIKLSYHNKIAIGDQFALCNQTFQINDKVQFAFSPICGDYIFIGVCVKAVVQKRKFTASFQKEQINHGAYLISSTGLAFSSLQKEINYKPIKLRFRPNDIVIVQLDNINNNIVWIVVEQNEQKKKLINDRNTYQMKVESSLELTPCVYLKYNSSVKIVDEFEQYL